MSIDGACLCGRVRYRVSAALIRADHCHCSLCRKQHGAAFATYADFPPDAFDWTEGAELITCYERPSGAGWCFCSACGSTLAGSENGKVTSITLGSVEGDPDISPECHIFIGSSADWTVITDDLPRYKERKNQ